MRKEDISKLCTGFLDNKLITVTDDTLYYNGFQFNKYSGRCVRKEFKSDNKIVFECKNLRGDERFRKERKFL